jgi:succinate dehydrogenase / fumarate reductase flavoprotein subunit
MKSELVQFQLIHLNLMRPRKCVRERIEKLMSIQGTKSVDSFHKRLGKVMWDKVGMSRNETGLKEAIAEIRQIREEFWKDVRIPGPNELNPELKKQCECLIS